MNLEGYENLDKAHLVWSMKLKRQEGTAMTVVLAER